MEGTAVSGTIAADRKQRYFEDLEVGAELPRLTKGPMTTMHIMRWSAAMENWHRIHFDRRFARGVDGLPDVLVNGSWKQQVLCQLVKDFAGRHGWMWRIRFQFRDMDPAGNTIIAGGSVEELAEHDGLGYVRCSIFLANQLDKTTTHGAAIAVLPKRGGRAVPYPFVPPEVSPVTWP
jgi:acyl dehydratase